jgi:hypothetical protein
MFSLKDSHHFRKMVAGVCMVLAPALILVAEVVHPERHSDAGEQLAVIAANQDAWYAAHLVAIAGIVLLLPAVLGLMHMLREREPMWGALGGGLGMLGVVATSMIIAIEGFVGWQAGAQNSTEMVALFDAMQESAGIVVPVFVMGLALNLGVIALAFGMFRARAIHPWMAAALMLAAIGFGIAGFGAIGWLGIVSAAVLFVALGSVGRMVLRESDEDWEHTPEYRGVGLGAA